MLNLDKELCWKTIPEIKNSMSNIKDVKKMKSLFAVGAKRLMAADPLLWGFSIDDVFKNLFKNLDF